MAVQVLYGAERHVLVIPEAAITRMEYHEKLNVILVGSEEGTIFVLDTNLGDVLHATRVADAGQAWDFYVGIDRIAVATKDRIGIRSDYNGIFLLNSILQSPVPTGEEIVDIELSKTEAELLCQSLVVHNMKAQDADTVEFVKVLKEQLLLAKQREDPGQDSTFSVKKEKWNLVHLKFRHSSMKSALQGIVNELLRRTQYNPQLSIASSILERLNSLLPPDVETLGTLDKSVMFSEAARLNSFLNWPHRNYKWAHPVKMAQAGFFHSPSTTGEDRAMCFTCNVCLVSWEPTDEPWSEHERHSPFCPFVRGEHTHNVPMTLAYSTCPALNLTNKLETPILGKSSWQNAVPVCYPNGLILILDTLKLPKEVLNFELTLMDLQGTDPSSVVGYCDIAMKPQEAWVDDFATPKSLGIDDTKYLRGMDLSCRVTLSGVALISSEHCPPSLVVSGATISGEEEWLDSWILVFSLDPSTLSTEDIFDSDTSGVNGAGLGTKREPTQFDDESFGTSVSAISESDMALDSMISDSITVFSESNVSDSDVSFLGVFPNQPGILHVSGGASGTPPPPAMGFAKIPSKTPVKSKWGPPNVLLVQKLALPPEVRLCRVNLLEPTQDKTKLVVVVGYGRRIEQFCGAILVYRITVNEGNIVILDAEPIAKRFMERDGEVPISTCFVTNDAGKLSIACVCGDGSVNIFSLPDLMPQFIINPPREDYDHKITSVAYCSSIEKLWCGTSKGFLNAYSIGVNEGDDETAAMTTSGADSLGNSPFAQADLILNKPLNTASLQQLLQLTKFENVKLPFSVNAPSCWQRVIQAQKERKHPQHLHREAEWNQSSYSWRLQRNKESKKEHLFEITFPKTANVGHVDFKFSFQSGCTTLLPFEVTLYMARNVHSKRGVAPQVDRGIDFGQQMSNRSSEFLKSANAEVVCGPLQLANHLDFSTQGGTLVMTSPALLLTKGRNFFLHLKATKHPQKAEAGTAGKEQKQPSPKKKCSSSKCPKIKSSSGSSHKKFTNHPLTKGLYKAFGLSGKENPFYYTPQMKAVNRNAILEELEKRKELEGCDWLHEISITVRQIKESPLPNSEMERKAMLTSPEFVRRLLQVVTFVGTEVSYAAQSIALDMLGWIAGIKLCGPQLDSGRYQLDFVEAVEQNLSALILKCILLADRSTAHKCAKLLILCFDVVEVYHQQTSFLESLLKDLLILLPFTLQCTSAGALQWYFLLLNQVRTVDPSLISESMLEMLSSVSKELIVRTDQLHAILRSRFGLYGTPFQPDLFDIEIAPFTKSVSTSTTYPGVNDGGAPGFSSGGPQITISSSKEIDFRDFLLGNPLRQTKLGILSPKMQIHGLLEVEPLHFSCHTSSEGARLEKMDSGCSPTFSPLPMPPQHWDFTNMPTGEGSKKSEPEKMEPLMLLQNLGKLNSIKLDQLDTYYDYLNDIKMLEGNLNLIDMMTFQPNSSTPTHGYLTGTIQGPGGGSYSAYINPNQMLKQPHIEYDHAKAKSSMGEASKAGPIKKSILQKTEVKGSAQSSSKEEDSLRLLISPWQQMMYIPNQQALVIDRMHSGARRFVVLDFGSPILLTDLVISPCSDLASLSIDIWLKREEVDGQRLVIASDISQKALVINDLQPPPICRYLKITTIGRYGMGTTKCKIPLGMFYGHSAILPHDMQIGGSEALPEIPVLSCVNTPAHLSILGYVLEDIGCRYQLACGKLKRLLEPLAKPEIASIDHISYYLPKGKERTKLGLNSTSDQLILSSYQDCITLQQQLNVTRNVIGRLQRSLEPSAAVQESENPMSLLSKVPTDKVRLISSFLVESLLGISFMSSKRILDTIPYPLYSNMTQTACSDLFQNICVMENAQCQLTACTFLLRVCGFQPWWGNFLTSTLKNLFSSTNTSPFPQDRVFTLLVYLGQRMTFVGQVGRKSCVLESTMRLLEEILSAADEFTSGFTRAKIDMGLLGWAVMFLCLCLDGVTHSILIYNTSEKGDTKKLKGPNKNVTSVTSRWNFIQGESVLHQSLNDTLKSSNATGIKRRMQKKTSALKQKLEDLGNSALATGAMPADFQIPIPSILTASTGSNPLTSHMSFQQKVEHYKQMHSGGSGKGIASSKTFADLLFGRKGEVSKRLHGSSKFGREGTEISDIGLNLNLNPLLCYNLAKSLGSFLLKMDSTCHSDIYLLLCKALARVATSCRPGMRLGEIFTDEQILSLVQTGVGNDYVRQVNWSSSWVSHAIMCLILDLLEGEKLFPEADKTSDVIPLTDSDTSFIECNLPSDVQVQLPSEPMQLDVLDAENETATLVPSQSSSSTSVIYIESESDYESVDEYSPFGAPETTKLSKGARQILAGKDLQPTASSLLASLDSRMDSGIDCSTEARLRMLTAIQSEVVTKSLDVIDVPLEVLRNVKTRTGSYSSTRTDAPIEFTGPNSVDLLSSCFDDLFRMMANENCSINIEKVLLFWLNINVDPDALDMINMKPMVALSSSAASGLITALARNVGIGVQDWGLGFKCLSLVANQSGKSGIIHPIVHDPKFPEMILKFISGSGINLQRTHVPVMGPAVCEDFETFFARIFGLCQVSSWTSYGYLIEVFLRILSEFLCGPFLGSEFPLDAFNKFLDVLQPHFKNFNRLNLNPAVLISVVDHLSHALHLHVFSPNKIVVKSNAELKGAPHATTATGMPLTPAMSEALRKPQNLENLLTRLLSLVSDIVTFSYGKSAVARTKEHEDQLRRLSLPGDIAAFERLIGEHVDVYNATGKTTVLSISDIVVHMDKTMMRIFSVLANPNGKSTLSEDEMASVLNFTKEPSPNTIADYVIRLVSRLMSALFDQKQIVQPLFKFLAKSPSEDFCSPLIVSQMFVLTVLKVIKEEDNLLEFVNSNCVQSICNKLVASSQQFFSSCPTFASIIMQYIGRADSNTLFGQRRYGDPVAELPGGIINVAPLGTITAVNFSAHPSEVLLQATPPHRRARAPVWSYHFYPEETFLELIVTLPCAILLKEVQIVPHISSLATSSPSAVMIEISRERSSNMVAMSPPVQCSGMTTINIQLTQAEVAQTVLLRLYKPKDSSTLGLSQIRILGCTTFCESAFEGLSHQHIVKGVESSAQWMYILDHAITSATPELRERIIECSVNIPDILQSCYSMLICPTTAQDGQDSYLPHVASLLFHFGRLPHVNDRLMKDLLGPVQLAFSHGMIANTNVQSMVLGSSQLNTTVDLIYKLCCVLSPSGRNNLSTVIDWLEKCADEAVEHESQGHHIVPEYVQGVAAALWSVTATRKLDLSDLVTHQLLEKLLNWSKCLNLKSELKATVDHMICSMCYCKPWLFGFLSFKMGILEGVNATESSETSTEEILPLQLWYEENSIWEHLRLRKLETTDILSSPMLMTLARAAESETASTFIFESGLLKQLNALILHFWNYNQAILMNGVQLTEEMTCPISTPQLIAILEFYGELCSMNRFKDWFGTEGSTFWHPILHLLSIAPSNLKASCFGSHLYDLEYMVIQYLTRCCSSHPENQKLIAARLCDIIVTQKQSPHKAVFLHSLSSFCRRLLIQVLLENEKMVVQVKNFTKSQFKYPASSLPLKDRHPSMGVNGRDRIFLLNLPSNVQDFMKLLEPSVGGNSSESTAGRRKEDPGTTYIGVAESIPASEIMIDEQPIYSLEEDVLQEIFGFDAGLKMSMKTPSKKARSDKSREVVQVPTEPEPQPPTFLFEAEEFPDVKIPRLLNLSKVKAAIREQNSEYFLELLVLVARNEVAGQGPVPVSVENSSTPMDLESSEPSALPPLLEKIPDIFKIASLPTTIEVFCQVGGFGLLAKHLPVVYPDTLRQMSVGVKPGSSGVMTVDKEGPLLVVDSDWVKIESTEEFYEEMMDGLVANSTPIPNRGMSMKPMGVVSGLPPHSMAAFGLFLGLPKYSEVLLLERLGAQCMLRLAMGVADDADGNDIFFSPIAKTLPTLPFQVLRRLLNLLPLTSPDGKRVREAMYESKAIHFILACLAIFTHQSCDSMLVPSAQHDLVLAATKLQGEYLGKSDKSDDKSHVYWAKGTGFGTGSTQETWSVERAMEKRVAEEENVTCLLQVLSSYINPQLFSTGFGLSSTQNAVPNYTVTDLPPKLEELLQSSCLFSTISLYLKNDSVLDMARHIPLYTAVLQFLRSLVNIPKFIPLLDLRKSSGTDKDGQRISFLLQQMKSIVDSYSKRLTNNNKKGSKQKCNESLGEELQDEGLATLIYDIQSTATFVQLAVDEYAICQGISDTSTEEDSSAAPQLHKTLEDIYLEEMKKLQFAFFEMIVEDEETSGIRFTVAHFYDSSIRTSWTRSAPSRLKRLAQESITLSTSLPIAMGSTIFVRCDTDRLDVMKVLITGPAGTPYSNGCFEFDVYFPTEYPSGPMLIHLQTTGRQRIRFNPNLYADGKVCLSILNTWHGRPEEKWNPQTSSLLPVLVAIQSLILNAEPYFNEPGYEKSRGTEGGEKSSREYNAGIEIATLEWAMLDQIRHPSVCFKEVIHKHFWLKRNEILAQCQQWYEDLITTCRNDRRVGKAITGSLDPVTVFKNNLSLLRTELQNMAPPPGLEFLADSLPPGIESELGSAESNSTSASEASQEVVSNNAIAAPEAVGVSDPAGALVIQVPETDNSGDVDEPMITDAEAF